MSSGGSEIGQWSLPVAAAGRPIAAAAFVRLADVSFSSVGDMWKIFSQ